MKNLINLKLIQELKKSTSFNEIYHFFSPARINLIGEHIDYVGGLVMPASISLGIDGFASRSDKIKIKSINFSNTWNELEANDFDKLKFDIKDNFMNFVKGILFELKHIIKPHNGFNLILNSSIPISSGLSSSAAFGMIVIEVLDKLYNLKLSRIDKVLIFKRVENNFIGLKSGIMDQFAITFGKKNHFILLNTNNLKYKYIKSNSKNYKFILISSNKSRELANSSYNERVFQLQKISKIINKDFLSLSKTSNINDIKKINDITLQNRLQHIVDETKRVKFISQNLKNISGKELGKILNESHESLDKKYQVSCDELNFIHSQFRKIKGVWGGRIIGAGFGGCYLGIVEKDFQINNINFHNEYKNKFGLNLDVFEVNICEGLRNEKIE